jgi:hypothetical protein
MRSTADKVLSELQARGFKKRGTEWRGNHPFKPDSDSESFAVTIRDGEHGAYKYWAGNEQGSLYDLAKLFDIETPNGTGISVSDTKISYQSLDEYAQKHYAPVEAFTKAGWQYETIYNRPAITWEVRTGKRVRWCDTSEFMWLGGGSNCWYGLDRAIQIAYERSYPIVLCNGEASTIVAQHYGIPAFSGTGGEGAISDEMKKYLDDKWQGQVIIALDCDTKGRDAAQDVHTILGRGAIIDLGLSDKGDLADFCGLHANYNPMKALQALARTEMQVATDDLTSHIEFISNHALLIDFGKFLEEDPSLFGRTIRMPFHSMRAAGGFASIMTTKKVWFIGNISGGGKTLMSETLCDEYNRLGYNVVYIGSEWSPMELQARQVQRAYKGLPLLTYNDYLQIANGVQIPSHDMITNAAYAARAIRSRPGKTWFMSIKNDVAITNPDKMVVFLEDTLNSLAQTIQTLRANNENIDVVVMDYLSLYETRGTANNLEEYKAGVFKAYCNSLDVLGISTVQVKKEAEDRVVNRGGFLGKHDLYWVRPDKANFITTMNVIYKPRIEVENGLDPSEAVKPYLNLNGEPEPTPNFGMSVVKNSVGSPYHHAYFHFDYDHLRVIEGLHPDYEYSKTYGIPIKKIQRYG